MFRPGVWISSRFLRDFFQTHKKQSPPFLFASPPLPHPLPCFVWHFVKYHSGVSFSSYSLFISAMHVLVILQFAKSRMNKVYVSSCSSVFCMLIFNKTVCTWICFWRKSTVEINKCYKISKALNFVFDVCFVIFIFNLLRIINIVLFWEYCQCMGMVH